MLKIIFNLGLVSVLSFNLYGQVKKCDTFSPTITDAESYYKDAKVAAKAAADYGDLKSIYDCVLVKGKAVSSAAEPLSQASYEDAIREALILDNSSAKYNSTLIATIDRMRARRETFTSADKLEDRIASLFLASDAVVAIESNSKTIASGLYTLSAQQKQKKVEIPIKDKIIAWKKDDKDADIKLDKASLLSDLENTATANKDAADLSTKLSEKLKGEFATNTDTKIADFKTNIGSTKYNVTPPDFSGLGATPITGVTGNTGGTQGPSADSVAVAAEKTAAAEKAAAEKAAAEKAAAEKATNEAKLLELVKSLTNNNNNGNNNNNVAAPVLTSDKDKGNGGGGGAGSLAGASISSRNNSDDDDRKEMIARAKEREKMMMRLEMQRALYGNNPSGKALPANKMIGSSGGGSLRDLFAKRFEDADKTLAKKGDVPSIFGADNDEAKSGDEKYKSYFKSGTAPSSVSTKEIALNKFSNMYEAARLNALTEDADQEFAGRYIDLFLLVHTILDHEYREKGKLIDITELIPSPLGPAPYKQRP